MHEQPKFHRHNVPAARELRKRMTESERVLWERLRAGKLNGLKWRRQHPVGAFVLDFYCEWSKLAVEVDGGIHLVGAVAERDRERQAALEELGIRFLRVPADRVMTNLELVLEEITRYAG